MSWADWNCVVQGAEMEQACFMPRLINVILEMYCVHRPRYAAAAAAANNGVCCGKAEAFLFQSVFNELVHKEGMAYTSIVSVGVRLYMSGGWTGGNKHSCQH